MTNQKHIHLLCFLISTLLLATGCGGGGGGGGSSSSDYTPSAFDVASLDPKAVATLDKLNSFTSNTANLAIDLPVTKNTYLLTITNTSPHSQLLKLCPQQSANTRGSLSEESDTTAALSKRLSGSNDWLIHDIESTRARLHAIKNMANKPKFNSNIRLSKSSRSAASQEIVGEVYPINVVSPWDATNIKRLPNCKLVAATEHAKFFVDQDHPNAREFEMDITEGEYAFAKVFDQDQVNVFQVMNEYFGTAYDVDKDGKISILITPEVDRWGNLLGLFNPDVLEITDGRDIIFLSPINNHRGNKRKQLMFTTLIHEYQHAINYSYRAYYSDFFNKEYWEEELKFDEGSSVYAEAIFRRERAKAGYNCFYNHRQNQGNVLEETGNDHRFLDIDRDTNIPPLKFSDYQNNLTIQEYSYCGLFMLFLSDVYGKEKVKAMVQNGTVPDIQKTIADKIGNGKSFSDLEEEFHLALSLEQLKSDRFENGKDFPASQHTYKDWLKLYGKVYNKKFNTEESIGPGCSLVFKIQPNYSNTSNNMFRCFVNLNEAGATSRNLSMKLIGIN